MNLPCCNATLNLHGGAKGTKTCTGNCVACGRFQEVATTSAADVEEIDEPAFETGGMTVGPLVAALLQEADAVPLEAEPVAAPAEPVAPSKDDEVAALFATMQATMLRLTTLLRPETVPVPNARRINDNDERLLTISHEKRGNNPTGRSVKPRLPPEWPAGTQARARYVGLQVIIEPVDMPSE